MMLKLIISLAFLGSVSSDSLGSVYPSSLGSTLRTTHSHQSPLGRYSLGGYPSTLGTSYPSTLGTSYGNRGLGYQSSVGLGSSYGYGQSANDFQHGFQHGQQLGGYGYGYGMGGMLGSPLGGLGGLGGIGGLGYGMGGIGQLLMGNTNPLIRNMLVRNLLEQLMEKHLTEINAATGDVPKQTQILDTFASEVMHLGYHLRL